MQHPATNAEIARLSHAHALREGHRSRRLDERDAAGPEPVEQPHGPVARLAGRLLPELRVTLPWPVAVRRAAAPRPR